MTKQQLLKEAKILESKLANVKKQIAKEETLRMQMLAGVITEGQYKKRLNEEEDYYLDEEEDYDLDGAFKKSPSQAPYEDVLEIVKSYEDIEELNKFKSRFPKMQPISKGDYYKFAYSSIDDMSEISNIKANWISIFDEDVYEKAGLL